LHSANTKDDEKIEEDTSEAGEKDEEKNLLQQLFVKDENDDAEDEDEEEEMVDTDPANIANGVIEEVQPTKKKKVKIEETPERLERTLFVGNVALTVTKNVLQKIFLKFGKIETIRFRSFVGVDGKTPRKATIIKKTFHSECKSMNAYIVYKDKDSVGKALQCNGIVLEDLHLRVDRATPSMPASSRHSLFVGNLPFNVSEEALYKHFEGCGDIECVRVVRDKASGMGKGIGYINFKTLDGAVFGIKLNASKLDGREIRVNHVENSRQKKSAGVGAIEKSFCGLRSTSKKDREQGNRLVVSTTKNNAMRRLKGKAWSQKKQQNKSGQQQGKSKPGGKERNEKRQKKMGRMKRGGKH